MDKEYRNITPEEVFFIFKEEHRICSPLDFEADPTVKLSMESSIREWRDSMDLLPWRKLSKYLNEEFEINIPKKEWEVILEPDRKKKLADVCELISKHAQIEIIKPIKVFGQECLSASIFKTIKRNLAKRGVDTAGLKPSSPIEPYLKNNFGEFIEQINKNYTGVIPEIKNSETTIGKINSLIWITFMISLLLGFFWRPIWIITTVLFITGLYSGFSERREFKENSEMMYIPEIRTFRELVEAIIEKKYAIQQ